MQTRFLVPLLAGTIWAQQSFTPTVIALPGAPSQVLYGTFNGEFIRSSDGGSTWTPIYLGDPGSPQPPIQSFLFDAVDKNTIYIASNVESGGVWRSTDAGATWTKANSGLPTTGGPVLSLKQLSNTNPSLYVRVGDQVYRSDDGANSWNRVGALPGSSGALVIADAPLNTMYFIDANTLTVSTSFDLGHSWNATGSLNVPPAPGQVTLYASLIANAPQNLYVSLITPGIGAGPYVSTSNGGSFTDASGSGLGLFTKIDSAAGQTIYAFGYQGAGFYRSDDNGQTWHPIGVTGATPFTLGAVDPLTRSTIYAIRGGSFPGFVKSTDSGVNWSPISATITPTLAKPASGISATLEQGAPFSQSFTVRAFEDATWPLSVTITTTGEPWLKVGAGSGTTPLAESVTIDTTGLAAGTYQSSITISAPKSFNQSVTIPVKLTVLPAGTSRSAYSISTIAGNGDSTAVLTNGPPVSVGIGAAKAVAYDNSGRLLISAGNRIWQVLNGVISPVAGNGAFASTGDGTDALTASIADPDSLLLDAQGTIYFPEFSTGRIRKLLNGALSTVVDLSKLNTPPTHSLLMDSVGRLLIVNPNGIFRYDGVKLQTVTAYAMNDPYSMVSDASGNIYVSDRGAHRILKFSTAGVVTVVAGQGAPGFGGDEGPAAQAVLNTPSGLAIDGQGTLYIADTGNQRIRTITPDGTIHTIAGSGIRGFAGDGSTADFASFQNPTAVAVDSKGNISIADTNNNRVRSLTAAVIPAAKPTAIVHAASGSLQIAPGGLFSIYGDSLSLITDQASSSTWPTTLGGVSVTINGIRAPLYYASKGLINGQVPYEVVPGTATVVVTINGAQPATITGQVVAANPGLLLYNSRALAVNPDASVNGPTAPASPNNFLILYLSGIGNPDHAIATGAPAPSVEPFDRVNYPASITVGGQSVRILYLGLAPGYPALAQANIIVPALPPGDYPVVVTVNGVQSNSANITIGN